MEFASDLSWFLTAGTPLGDYVEHTNENFILEACIHRGSVDHSYPGGQGSPRARAGDLGEEKHFPSVQ
jgi:hypothetical protein